MIIIFALVNTTILSYKGGQRRTPAKPIYSQDMSGSLYRGDKKLIGKLATGKEIYGNLTKEQFNAQFDSQAERDEWRGIVAREGKGKKGKYGKKKGATRNYVKKKTAGGRSRGGGSGGGAMSGTNIIYPNVVGRGAYYIGGGIGYDSENGWSGGLKGYYTDQDVKGLGAYSIRSNSHMHLMDLGQPVPSIRNTNMGEAFVINHREYLGDLYSDAFVSGTTGTVFSLQSYNINPGNSKMFPFLSNIARNFQEYEIRGMLVCLRTLASDYASTLALGSVFAAADYNVYGDSPISKVQIENMEYSESAKPSKSFIMPIECDPQNNGIIHKKVAIDDEYHGGDKNNYDWAHLFIGSQGIPQEHTPLAEIHITYEVAFFKPIINGNDLQVGQGEGAAWRLVNCSSSRPLGTEVAPFAGNAGDITIDVTADAARLFFPKMRRGDPDRLYLVTHEYSNATAGTFTHMGIGVNHCTPQACFSKLGFSNGTDQVLIGWTNSSDHAQATYLFRCRADPDKPVTSPYILFSSSGTIPANSKGTIWCTLMPKSFDPELSEVQEITGDGIPLKNPLLENYIEEEVKRRVQGLKRTTSC